MGWLYLFFGKYFLFLFQAAKNVGAMHFIYQINRLRTTKVDSSYLGQLANNAQRIIPCSRARLRHTARSNKLIY